jgi:hypothetical protein
VIFGGYGRKMKQRGEVYFICFECERLNVFGLLENYGYAQVYGVRVAKYKSERFMACSHCQRGWDLDQQQWTHALRVAKVLRVQPNLTPRQLAQSALVLAEGAFPDLSSSVREVLADELSDGLDDIFKVLPPADDDSPAAGVDLASGKSAALEPEPASGLAGLMSGGRPRGRGENPASASGEPPAVSEPPEPERVASMVAGLSPMQEEKPVPDGEQDEVTDEEIEAQRKALRYRLVEAVESTGWGVQLTADELILGDGRARLVPLPFERVLIYSPIQEPSFSPDDVNAINADSQFAVFFTSYLTANDTRAWGGFLRLSLPKDDVSSAELGRWLDAQIFDVLGAAEFYDEAMPDDD